ncbi:unnamed protein product [Vicia faba]|uniref:Peroxidase n=1 Tax=Vicia faba TaxID=3906 RepID=A0AAV1BDL8_VICFA|nr:unnamed protein product [Vicia faba]
MASYYFLLFVLVTAFAFSEADDNELRPGFYGHSCPKLLSIVKQGVLKAIHNEARIGASLLRLHFHDCFVNGCDGSILLDDTNSFIGEKTAVANNNSARGFNVIDEIKANVEKACPSTVSCADILALAARDAVVTLGGPSWEVGLGRRDSMRASRGDANRSIPAPFLNLDKLKASFANQGLSEKDLVALSGAHTIGLARCSQFRAHIYNGTNIDPSFAKSLQSKCPRTGNDNLYQPFDFQTPTHFDNLYYKHLLAKKALVHSDQELFNGNPTTDKLVQKYANDNQEFFQAFAEGMLKMSNINPLTGSKGQIRINCRKNN